MPKYIDYHATMPALPPEVAQQLAAQIKEGKPNPHGLVPLNFFMGASGQAYCLSQAPSAEAVRKTHEAMGVPLASGDIVEVTSLV